MKKTTLLGVFLLAILLVSCKSKEEKIAEQIKNDMFTTLFDFSSYEPVETVIDSAYYSVYQDSVILSAAKLALFDLDKFNKYLAEVESAESSMDIWRSSSSSYGMGKYLTAKEKFDENLNKSKSHLENVNKYYKIIKDRAPEIKPTFYGWQATHKFRCKNKGGNFDLGNYLYIFDKDIKHIIHQEDLDEKSIARVKGIIDEALTEDEK